MGLCGVGVDFFVGVRATFGRENRLGKAVRSSPNVVFSARRVSATQPDRSASASSSRAQRVASVRLSNDLQRGGTPLRRTIACQRPRSCLMVAIDQRASF